MKKWIITLLLLSPLCFLGEDINAQRSGKRSNSSRDNKKKRNNKKSDKKNSSKTKNKQTNKNESIDEIVTETETEVEIEKTETIVQETKTIETNIPTSNDDVETTTSLPISDIPDMSQDAQWESFRICMQQICAGGDNQPTNVECYKKIQFDNAFLNCKGLIEESKVSDYRNYFSGPFINKEKKEFCEGDLYSGEYNSTTGKCAISVTYTRPKVDAKFHGCNSENKTKTWYIDSKNYICDAEQFNVNPCYQDNANVTAEEAKEITGWINVAAGTLTGVASAFSAAKNHSATETKLVDNVDANGNKIQTTQTVAINKYTVSDEKKKEFNKDATLTGITTGISAGLGGVANGVASIASANVAKREKGERVYGICTLSNGEVIPEGSSIKLSW